jgi:hypothetical protein
MIYVNGDSYSAENNEITVYSKYIEELLGDTVINSAVVGSSNDRIIRTTIEDCLKFSPSLAIIGLSFITREEVWWKDSLVTLDSIKDDKQGWNSFKDKIVDLNINHQMIHFYTKVFMLIKTLEQLNIDYLIFSAADNIDFRALNWDYLKTFRHVNLIWENQKVIDFHSFNVPLWAKENNYPTTATGHLLTSNGHYNFANYLLSKKKN